MKETFDEYLIRQTEYRPIDCNCIQCQKQCKTPCLGTPDDILLLINNGYKEKLSKTLWCVGMLTGHLRAPVAMVQSIKTDKGCTFFKDGLCELHDLGLKPTEGRFSYHTNPKDIKLVTDTISWNVAMQWIEPQNTIKILEIFNLM